jgi:hypothetical protein
MGDFWKGGFTSSRFGKAGVMEAESLTFSIPVSS